MKFGLHIPLPGQGSTAEFARLAEAASLDYITCGEHVLFETPTPSAFVSLATAAAVTERIAALASIVLLPLYPAAVVAKMAAVLDVESGGRFHLGIGTGGDYPREFEACGVPVSQRGSRADEALAVIRALWSGERVTFEGRYNRLTDVVLQPVPIQRPGVPVWVAGRKEGAMKRAGMHGDYWFPYMYTPEMLANSLRRVRTHSEEAGRRPDAVRGSMFLYVTTYDDPVRARQVATETVGRIYSQDFEHLADRYLLHGTPADCRRRLREFEDAGCESLIFLLACPPEDTRAMLDRFAHEVVPELRP